MRLAVLAFAGGALAVSLAPALPGWPSIAAAGLIAALALYAGIRIPGAVGAAALAAGAFLAGCAWAAADGTLRLDGRLEPAMEGRDIEVVGVIASLPQPFERGVRFELDIEDARATPDAAGARLPERVMLSWFNGYTVEEFQTVPPVRAGERWRLTVRLKRPHGNANPHGFDYERWLAERRIGATGYVRPRGTRERLDAFVARPGYVVARARERIRERFLDAAPEARYAGVLIALAIGDQRAILSQDWDVFTRTGIGHLMSISGLHVTMVSGLFAWLVAVLWRRSGRLMLRVPAQKAAAAGAVVAALAYTLVAGFQVPAQRTLYMVTVVAIAMWFDRLQSSSRVLASALLAVLVLDPMAVVAPGFWLSFGAVAAMLYAAAGDRVHAGPVRAWARTQWAVTLGLAPVTVLLFQQVSLVSPVANAVAIPVVSLVVTPLALAAIVLPASWLLPVANGVLELLMRLLDVLGHLPAAMWRQHAPPLPAVVLALAGIGWLLAPRGTPARWVGALLLLPMLAGRPPMPLPGTAEIAVLDVGQGLATVVRTAGHTLVYDTGPRYSLEADAGNRVVVPYLRGVGVTRIDRLIVTHDDVDHSGGAASLIKLIPTALALSSLEPSSAILAGAPFRGACLAGDRWEWDGVTFEMLFPSTAAGRARPNERSCVLRVTAGGQSVLLTGDIEEPAERALVSLPPRHLSADVLLVPHHGSRTSSSEAFIDAAGPRRAIVPAGYRNRFGHPKEEVLERYRSRGVTLYRTDLDGALTFTLGGGEVRVERWRDARRRWWLDAAPSRD